jgi:hypothetical protein
LTFLNDEDGVEIMEEIFQKAEDGQTVVHINIINLLEVYNDRLRTLNALGFGTASFHSFLA